MDLKQAQELDRKAQKEEKLRLEKISEKNKAEIMRLEAMAKPSKYNDIQKSWDKLNKKIPHINNLVDQIESASEKLTKAFNELDEAILEAFHTAPETDTSLGLSPISSGKLWHYLKVDLIKKGLKGMGHVHNVHVLKGFKESVTEGLLWLVKLRDGEQLYGTAKQRAKQLANKRAAGK